MSAILYQHPSAKANLENPTGWMAHNAAWQRLEAEQEVIRCVEQYGVETVRNWVNLAVLLSGGK